MVWGLRWQQLWGRVGAAPLHKARSLSTLQLFGMAGSDVVVVAEGHEN